MAALLPIVYALAAGSVLGRAHLRHTLVRQLREHADYYGANLIARGRYRERP